MPKKILIIDDEPDFREVLSDFLTCCGYEMIEAGDGEQGLELLDRESPDLVILDMRMPRMDGIEVLREIRRKGIPAVTIVLSGIKESGAESEVLELGARRYLTKPVNLNYLTEDCIPALIG